MECEMTFKIQGTVNPQSTIKMEVVHKDYELLPTPPFSRQKEGVFSEPLNLTPTTNFNPFNPFLRSIHHISSKAGAIYET